MSLGDVAGLIAAIAFVALVGLVAVPLVKLGRVLDELRGAVRDLGAESVPILTELQGTVKATNDELTRLHTVTDEVAAVSKNANAVSTNAAQVTSLLTTAVGTPVVKTIAFTRGVRQAIRREPRSDLAVIDDAVIDHAVIDDAVIDDRAPRRSR